MSIRALVVVFFFVASCAEDGGGLQRPDASGTLPDSGTMSDAGPALPVVLRGQVLRPSGEIAPGAVIYRSSEESKIGTLLTTADNEGRFELTVYEPELFARYNFGEAALVTVDSTTTNLVIQLMPISEEPRTLNYVGLGVESRLHYRDYKFLDFVMTSDQIDAVWLAPDDRSVVWTSRELGTATQVVRHEEQGLTNGSAYFRVHEDREVLLNITDLASDRRVRTVTLTQTETTVASEWRSGLMNLSEVADDNGVLHIVYTGISRQPDEAHGLAIWHTQINRTTNALVESVTQLPQSRDTCVALYDGVLFIEGHDPSHTSEYRLDTEQLQEQPHQPHELYGCGRWVDQDGLHGVIIGDSNVEFIHERAQRRVVVPRPGRNGTAASPRFYDVFNVGTQVLILQNLDGAFFAYHFDVETDELRDLTPELQSLLHPYSHGQQVQEGVNGELVLLARSDSGAVRVSITTNGRVTSNAIPGSFDSSRCGPVAPRTRIPLDPVEVVECINDDERTLIAREAVSGLRRSFFDGQFGLGREKSARYGVWVARSVPFGDTRVLHLFNLAAPR